MDNFFAQTSPITAGLADVVVSQVGHLLEEALALARSPIGEKESRSGVRIAFAGETQRRLVLVAMATNLTDRYESRYYTTRRLAKLTTISALVVGVLSGSPATGSEPSDGSAFQHQAVVG